MAGYFYAGRRSRVYHRDPRCRALWFALVTRYTTLHPSGRRLCALCADASKDPRRA